MPRSTAGSIGGVPATVQYYGAAPVELAGVMQFNWDGGASECNRRNRTEPGEHDGLDPLGFMDSKRLRSPTVPSPKSPAPEA
jgi:hypothetical protein